MTDHATYLDAKRALDDRSLNRDVLERFAAELPPEPTVLEVGAGTATMVERFREWGVIGGGRWVAVDAHEGALDAGRRRLAEPAGAGETGSDGAADAPDRAGGAVRLGDLAVEFVADDAFEFAADAAAAGARFDAVVGCAFFDVVDAAPAVEALGAVAPVAYAPITYDGETRFAPPDPGDAAVLDRYHRHMREYRPGSPDGAAALAREATVIAEGPSGWEIAPPYGAGERVVLGHLLDTVADAVAETGFDAGDWADRRRRALREGRLRYAAANRDLLVALD